MIKKDDSIEKLIYWSYANLAMAHTAVVKKQKKYDSFNFKIRARLFKGLSSGSMNMRSIFDDEKIKLQTGLVCNYCGSSADLALDHIFPQKKGGKDDAENLIFACKSCNSSKGKKDLMQWMKDTDNFLPLMVIRRYLKLVYKYCSKENLLQNNIEDLKKLDLPFDIENLPTEFPAPHTLKLNISDIEKYRIGNWNLERPKKKNPKTERAIKKIKELNFDILVLTETSDAVDLSEDFQYSISTGSFDRTPDEQWVKIWSNYRITKEIETFDKFRTVCCNIKTNFGEITVYGTIIPYHMAGVKGKRYGELGYKNWEYHEKDIINQSNDWKKIIAKEQKPFFLIGDFNQTRFGNTGYGTKKVRNLLTEKLNHNKIKCLTEIDFSKKHLTRDPKTGKIRNNIDHICISLDLLNKMKSYEVLAWNHFDKEGKYMSDHNGVYVDFKI